MDNIIYTPLFKTLATILLFTILFGSFAIIIVQYLQHITPSPRLASLIGVGTGYCIALLSSYHGMIKARKECKCCDSCKKIEDRS